MRATLLLGLLEGLTIALLALGLVLVYKAGRFVNFAHAQLGVVSSLLLGKLVLDAGLSWWLAFPLAVAAGCATGALCELVVIRRLEGRGRVTLLIATIGLSQVLLAFTYFEWLGADRDRLRATGYPLPFQVNIEFDALTITGQHVLIAVLVPAIAVGLMLLFRTTALGRVIRASASNRDAAALAGIDVRRVSTLVWAIAGGLSAASSILIAPTQAVFESQSSGPTLMLRALGGAAIGGFSSMPLTFAGGVGLGVIEAVALRWTRNGGTAQAVVFAAILIALFVRARAVNQGVRDTDDRLDPGDAPIRIPPSLSGRFLVRRQRLLLGTVGLALGVAAPFLPVLRAEDKTYLLTLTLVYAVVALSLTVLSGWGGQVSLGQFALLGVGAIVAARLAPSGWSLPATVVLAGVVGAVAAVVIGLPALRLHGLTLAVTTLGFAVIAPGWLFRQSWFAPAGTTTVPGPRIPGVGALTTQRSVYFAALVLLAVSAAALSSLRRSRSGRLLIAVRDNNEATAALGVAPTAVLLGGFALAGFMAAAAGSVWLGANRNLSAALFGPETSLVMLSLAVVGGISSIPGAILGATFIYAVPALLADWVSSVFPNTLQFHLFLGGTALLVTQISNPGGIAAVLRDVWQRVLYALATEQPEPVAAEPPALLEATSSGRAGRSQPAKDASVVLATRNVTVRFGGVVAVDDATVEVRADEVVGLIGANGAGKSTLVNAIAGTVAPNDGTIEIFDHDVTALGPEYRAHLGMLRTFQSARLFPGLTVRETVAVSLAHTVRTGVVSSLVAAPWVRFAESTVDQRVDEVLARFGLLDVADVLVADLSTGMRRLCNLAAVVVAEPQLLVLDEPTAGLAQREAEAFGPLLLDIRQQLGCAVLIIEHDMPMLMSISDRLYCLEAGRVIAEGSPGDVARNARVIASYLGTDSTAIGRSGPATPAPPLRARRDNGISNTHALRARENARM